ncbi:flagellar filament capping protein FliD [Brevibacillus massiliensis]|uniref:flagellar filament capping protein FliD n=1 Tax=Brevibacillus massiliensis TaxID=1118054 RepID=UPI0002F683D9|nr:flagellar filament capping protein FliD [Brevibacillus massiliensis]
MIDRIRFGGMYSGLDTEMIVKQLMKSESAPYDRLKQKQQKLEWKRDDYREANRLLLELKNMMADLRYASTFTNKKVAVSANDSVVSVKSAGKSQFSSYPIEVKELAADATPASVAFKTKFTDATTPVGADNAFKFNVKGQEIQVNADDTLETIVKKVNDQTESTGVKATIFNNQLVFTSTGTGNASNFTVEVTSQPASGVNVLGMDGSVTTSNGKDAKEGKVVINGAELSISSNTFTYDGIEYTVKQKTEPGSSVNISVKQDTDAIFNTIKGFVDKYNDVIAKLNDKISEPVYRDFFPLSDEQKSDMKDKDVENWEKKAKSGTLRNDTLLSGILSSMRTALNTKVSGVSDNFSTLSSIGITTGKYYEKGKLVINEEQLRKAISENLDDVTKLFTNYASQDSPNRNQESGLFERLYSQLDKTIKQISDKAGSATATGNDISEMGLELNRMNQEIDSWQDRLKKIEDRYWKQFTALEQAMAKSQSQTGWFSQLMGNR